MRSKWVQIQAVQVKSEDDITDHTLYALNEDGEIFLRNIGKDGLVMGWWKLKSDNHEPEFYEDEDGNYNDCSNKT